MPIARRKRQLARLFLPFFIAAVCSLVSVTAASSSLNAALTALAAESDAALTLLRFQLGDTLPDHDLPLSLRILLSQNPLLFSGRDAVLALRQSEPSQPTAPQSPAAPESTAPLPSSPATEVVQDGFEPIVVVDNGVPARTLVPSSETGYILTGEVYIDNRSDKVFDAAIFDTPPAASLTLSTEPQVLIFHTHGSEAYTMAAGRDYVPCGDFRTTDEAFSVVRVGEEIAYVLRNAGISVLHATTLHDYPQYSGAYERSLSTVEEYLERYPSISLVLDVHRDAVSDGSGAMVKVVSDVGGQNAAQMSFVVGTDGGGLTHPHWQENLKLAAAIQQTLCDSFPTLMRPITVRNSRYNQHTTTGSLLVEMGAAGNSLEEALLSARLLGSAIAATMQDPSTLSLR